MLGKHIPSVEADVLRMSEYCPFASVKFCWTNMDFTIALRPPENVFKSFMLVQIAFIWSKIQ